MKITDCHTSAAVMSQSWQITLGRHRQIGFCLITTLTELSGRKQRKIGRRYSRSTDEEAQQLP